MAPTITTWSAASWKGSTGRGNNSFIGPFDLTQALGVIGQPRHPLVIEAIGEITKKTRAAGKAVGIISSDAPITKQRLDMGIKYIAMSSDQAMIGYAGRQFMKELGRKG